jgi:hypothetical protein
MRFAQLAVPAVSTAAVVAACFTYLLGGSVSTIEPKRRQPPISLTPASGLSDTMVSLIGGKFSNEGDRAAQAHLEAAQAILKRSPEALASTRTTKYRYSVVFRCQKGVRSCASDDGQPAL